MIDPVCPRCRTPHDDECRECLNCGAELGLYSTIGLPILPSGSPPRPFGTGARAESRSRREGPGTQHRAEIDVYKTIGMPPLSSSPTSRPVVSRSEDSE